MSASSTSGPAAVDDQRRYPAVVAFVHADRWVASWSMWTSTGSFNRAARDPVRATEPDSWPPPRSGLPMQATPTQPCLDHFRTAGVALTLNVSALRTAWLTRLTLSAVDLADLEH